MKKVYVIVFCSILTFLVGLSVVMLTYSDNDDESKSGEQLTKQLNKACDELFTLEDAKEILGDKAEKADDATAASASSDDIAVSQCGYQQPLEPSDPKLQKQASLLVRSARSDKGKQANEDVFKGQNKPAGVENVTEYGESAFWNPEFGQLNILKNKNWYVLQYGTSVPSERNLGETMKFADILVDKL